MNRRLIQSKAYKRARLAGSVTVWALIALALLAGCARAEVAPNSGDVLRMQAGEIYPEVYYYNHAGKVSEQGTFRLDMDGVSVSVRIIVGADETIIVTPLDDEVIAVPERADVKDGEAVTITIMPPMF